MCIGDLKTTFDQTILNFCELKSKRTLSLKENGVIFSFNNLQFQRVALK